MKRFYVTMTWHDFPEGGSFGTVVEARDHNHAEELCREEMAAALSDECGEHEDVRSSMDWYLIDCFDLDEFIECYQKVEVKT